MITIKVAILIHSYDDPRFSFDLNQIQSLFIKGIKKENVQFAKHTHTHHTYTPTASIALWFDSPK